MVKTYVSNIVMGATVGLFYSVSKFDWDSLLGTLLLILIFLSYGARLIIAQKFHFIRIKNPSLGTAFIIAPIYLFAAFADFAALFSALSLITKSPITSSVYSFAIIGGVFGSIGTIFYEAKIAFNENKPEPSKLLVILSKIFLYLYCALAVTLIWDTIGNRLIDTVLHQKGMLGVFYLFIFYFLAVIPFQRHAFLETILKGKSVAHYFLSLLIGFGFVAWSVFL
ncbi:MAG: hypothetical protein HUJ25_08830 [Crocinitomicaceae bacterium]|nr:hypothetical protein [Crocinitomicaceae bacterium]